MESDRKKDEKITDISIICLFILLLAVSSLVILVEADYKGQNDNFIYRNLREHCRDRHKIVGDLSRAAGIILVIAAFTRRYSKDSGGTARIYYTVFALTITLLMLCTGFQYLYFSRGVCKATYVKYHDNYHYYLGAKYFTELGYRNLYECTVYADIQDGGIFRDKDRIRDLETLKFISVGKAMEKTSCRQKFEPDRWSEFKSDVQFYRNYAGGLLKRILQDHGYNGPPAKTFISSTIANRIPLNFRNLTWSSLIDVVGLMIMLVVVTRSFGWLAGLLTAIFLFTNFADRFYYIGGSFIRYAWMSCLGISIAAMRKKRYDLSGIFMGISTMLVVFPALFTLSPAARALKSLVKTKSIAVAEKKFFKFFAATATIMFILSTFTGQGLGNWTSFIDEMGIHSEKFTSSRIGLKYLFVYHGEIYRDDPSYSYSKKLEDYQEFKKEYLLLVAGILAAIGYVSLRMNEVSATILLGFTAFYTLFGSVEYYYTCMALLVLIWHDRLDKRAGLLAVAILLLVNAAAYPTYEETRLLEFMHNTYFSAFLGAYLLLTATYFIIVNYSPPGLSRKVKTRLRKLSSPSPIKVRVKWE